MVIGIDLRPGYSRYSILGEDGELLEHGSVRSSEAGLRSRFAAIPSSLVAVSADENLAWAPGLLAAMGHELVFSGELPAGLRPALTPLVEQFALQSARCGMAPAPGETRTVVFRRTAEPREAGLLFMVEVEDLLGRPAVSDAWYFAGPLTGQVERAALGSLAGATDGACAAERAMRLRRLCEMGEIRLMRETRVAAA